MNKESFVIALIRLISTIGILFLTDNSRLINSNYVFLAAVILCYLGLILTIIKENSSIVYKSIFTTSLVICLIIQIYSRIKM